MTKEVDIRKLILGYILAHPAAADSLEGIAKWWVTRQRIEGRIDEVSAVISLLVAQGLLGEKIQSDGRTVFSLNQERIGEIINLLDSSLLQ